MSTKPFRCKKWLTIAVVLGMMAVGPGRYFHHKYEFEIRKWLVEQVRWTQYRLGGGLLHDLAVGNIKAGDDIEVVLKKHPLPPRDPTVIGGGGRREDFGRWTIVTYGGGFEGTTLVAKNGKIVEASLWSCMFHDEFIPSQITTAENLEIGALRDAYYKLRRETRATLQAFVVGNAGRLHFNDEGKLDIAFPLDE